MTNKATALGNQSHAVAGTGCDAGKFGDTREANQKAVDVVVVAQAIGADNADPALTGQLTDFLLLAALLISEFRKATGKDDRRAYLARDATLKCLAYACRRHGQHGNVQIFWKISDVCMNRKTVDFAGTAANQVDVAREAICPDILKNQMSDGIELGRHANDSDRLRLHHAL